MGSTIDGFAYQTRSAGVYHVVVQNGKFVEERSEKEIFVWVARQLPFNESSFRNLPQGLAELDDGLRSVFTDFSFDWTVESCGGVSNAYYAPSMQRIRVCTPFLEENSLDGSLDQSAVPFVLMHEVGHGLLDQWGLPGAQNEQMADELGAVLLYLLTGGEDEEIGKAVRFWRSKAGNEQSIAEFVSNQDSPHPQPVQRGRNLSTFAADPNYYLIRWYPILAAHFTDAVLQSHIDGEVSYADAHQAQDILIARRQDKMRLAEIDSEQKAGEQTYDTVDAGLNAQQGSHAEYSLWLAGIASDADAREIDQQPLLKALITDYIAIIGLPNAFKNAINLKEPICLSACREFGESQVDIGNEISSSDFVRMLLNTRYGFVEDRRNRWAALERIDIVLSVLGVENVTLTKEDANYFAGEFKNLIEKSEALSGMKYNHIRQLIDHARALK